MQNTPLDPSGPFPWPATGVHPVPLQGDASAQMHLQAAAVTASGIAAWRTDLQTRERWWSAQMYAIHGLAADSEMPENYLALVHPEDCETVQSAFQQSLARGAHRVQYRVLWPDGSVHWLEGVGSSTRDASGAPQAITGVCTLIDERKQAEADLRFLALASNELARSADVEETLRRVAQLAVPHFADWCAVDMLGTAGELKRVAVAHIDPGKVRLAQELHRRYPPRREARVGAWNIVKTGKPEILPRIPEALLRSETRDAEHLAIVQSLGLQSYMGLPIVGREGVLGVVSFVSSESGRSYGEREFELAGELVSRAALALENAMLVRALRESDARQKFLLALTDVLRGSASRQQVLTRVCEMLGRHFGVDRVGYGHVDEHLDRIEYDVCWTDESVPGLLGVFPASAFGQQVIDRLRAGETIAIPNVREHPYTSDQAALRTSHEVETRAILVVPLFKAGALRTIVYLNQGPAREWTGDEVLLLEDVAERTRELIERDRAEQALRRSEARWRGLFESMAEGFFVAEAIRGADGRMRDFRFTELNPAFEKLTGVPVAAALGAPVTQAIPGIQPELIDIYAGVVDTGTPAEFETMVPALDNRWYEARARRIAPEQFSVMFLEITGRKRVEQELSFAAQRYRTLFESIDEGFCILEMMFDAQERPIDYRFVEVNPAFERQSGLVDAVGRTIRELVPGIEHAYIDTYGQVAMTGEALRFESHAAALHRWFDAFAFRVGRPEQRRVALLFTDITERRLAQQTLLEREAALHEAQRLAGIGSWLWDVASDRTQASPELLRIFGLEPPGELPLFAQQRGTLYPEEDWDRLNACVQDALATGRAYSVDLRACKNGQPIWVIARGTPVHAADGRITGLRGTIQEITERKQIEEALREADARKDEFLATLAHELRNPLAPLRNGLSLLRLTDAASATGVRARELMERQLTYLVRLVDDLLEVSRVNQGKVVMKRAPTSLRGIVDVALETARPVIDAEGHALAIELPDETVVLDVDATRIAQVLSNLLNNAAKYTPRGGHIGLRARRLGSDRLEVVVQDDGVGIPADMLEKVFELFTQVGSALQRSQGGLGIGLSLARRLVELHGGSVRATSDGEGRGSAFIVELPVVQDPDARGPGAAGDVRMESATAGRRILVVDDNRDAAETLSMLLGFLGHAVEVAHTGAAGLQAALRERPDVVFLDIGLPDISGYEVAARLRGEAALARTLLVALTGWGSERDQQKAKEVGFDVHLTKPVSPEDLSRALERAAARGA